MKERLINVLDKSNKALSIIELKDVLEIQGVNDLTKMIQVLNEGEKSLAFYRTNKDKYMIFSKSHLIKGKISIHEKGYGFVIMGNDSDIYIDQANINGAINNDNVIVEIIGKRAGAKQEGRVVRVAKREYGLFVGEYYLEKGVPYIKLDDKKTKLIIELEKTSCKDAVEGHKVVVEVIKEITSNKLLCQIIRIIGHKNDPGVDITSIIYSYGFSAEFSEEVMLEAESIPTKVESEELVDRKDLREEIIFTIDGEDAKDLDDAISINKLENSNYLLGVHIADVSHYVRPKTKIYEEAYERGTSVYLVDRVLPMLPHKLSNGICSLTPDVDRLTISCQMEIDKDGNIVNHDIFPSVIRSKIKMTYKNVNKVFNDEEINKDYEPYVKELFLMKELAKILRSSKEKRGYLDFDVEETKILVDEQGTPTDIVLRDRGIGEKLIEDFMIIANETVATHVFWQELPFIFRVHGIPKEERVNDFFVFLNSLGYKVNTNPKNIHPRDMQKVLEYLKDKPEFVILSQQLLRTMQKAVYQKKNIGHFGLASKIYTHFTSPIRRFPDTTVHQLLRAYLFNKDYSKETINYWEENLDELTSHCSLKERDAIECEREVESMKMAEYMEKHIGQEYDGMISGITNFGMFVQLPNMVEGLVHVTQMNGDFYHYNEQTLSMVGEKTKKAYKVGSKIKVRVKGASKEKQTIDFEIVDPLFKKGDSNEKTTKIQKKQA